MFTLWFDFYITIRYISPYRTPFLDGNWIIDTANRISVNHFQLKLIAEMFEILKLSHTADYSKPSSTLHIREFAVGICCENLPWLFAARICRRDLPWEFGAGICRGNFQWLFAASFLYL